MIHILRAGTLDGVAQWQFHNPHKYLADALPTHSNVLDKIAHLLVQDRFIVRLATYYCKSTSAESGTIGGRKEKEFVDDDLTTGKHPTI